MKKFFLSIIALIFPWLIILFDDNPGGALLAIALQATVIGWIPASIWALRIVHRKSKPQKPAKPPVSEEDEQ